MLLKSYRNMYCCECETQKEKKKRKKDGSRLQEKCKVLTHISLILMGGGRKMEALRG